MSNNDNREFVKSIKEATYEIIMKAYKNTEKACLFLEGEAKINCPVDQGALRASMFSKVSMTESEIIGTVGNSMSYAPYVHQGTGIYAVNGDGRKTPWKYKVKSGKYKGWHETVGQRPQPFLEDAKKDNKDEINKILGRGLGRG
ncbi:HK97 gp10 family phage protein [Clostridium sp. D2Q-14]|uniref:HK97-gp10 family putative phage morphogenesis protein n=1 Tax=Anaeromonas gelatinilytica TaxID=2683194 RepID=UPI00193C09DB|nr:HK97-gp10 family putative phage morphogenesis protein [Anaeromonas gelatinilytica]MBS4535831.1 HK97 gp10 family phage protein [Anaeromonas gelatinilytica]